MQMSLESGRELHGRPALYPAQLVVQSIVLIWQSWINAEASGGGCSSALASRGDQRRPPLSRLLVVVFVVVVSVSVSMAAVLVGPACL